MSDKASANPTPDADEVRVQPPALRELTDADEQKMFREAIPVQAPLMTPEEVEELRTQLVDPSAPASKAESARELFGTPAEADVTVSPYRYGGKLYFRKNGVLYVGSAQFVGEHNILLTAAHCVRDNATGTFFTDFIFYRAYKNGGYAKRFLINACGTKAGWVNATPARQYDYAFLRTTEASDVGHLGYKTLESEGSWTAFGYPQNYGNNQIMQAVAGTRGQVANGRVEMLGNPMRSGNSGGARFIVAGPNNRQVLGVDAFHTSNTANEWGPQFVNATFTLIAAVRDAT